MMNWNFKDRIVTKIGTIYSHFIGNSRSTTILRMDEIAPEAIALKGTSITIAGITSNIIDVEVSQRCNLVDVNYYVNILTDEEFEQKEVDFNI